MGCYNGNVYIINIDEKKSLLFDYENLNLAVINGDGNKIEESQYNRIIHELCSHKEMNYNDALPDEDNLVSLVICSTEKCNLKCSYCFANKGNYNSDGKKDIIRIDEYKNMYDKVVELFPKGVQTIQFFGGEPLIAFSDIKEFVLYVESKSKETGHLPIFSMISNGVLLTKEVIDFINEHHIFLTISVDANKEIHDMYRRDHNNCGSYDRILHNMEYIKQIEDKNFICTCESTIGIGYLMNYKKGDFDSYYESFREMGFDSVATFVVDDNTKITENFQKQIELFYKDMVDYVFKQLLVYTEPKKVPPFVIDLINNIVTKRRKRECRVGKTTLFYTAGGDLYPCSMFYMMKRDKLGNLYKNYDNVKMNMHNLKKVCRSDIDSCRSCFCKNLCQEWCEGSSLLNTGKRDDVIQTRCIVQRSMTEQVLYNLIKVKQDPKQYKSFQKNLIETSHYYSMTYLSSTAAVR